MNIQKCLLLIFIFSLNSCSENSNKIREEVCEQYIHHIRRVSFAEILSFPRCFHDKDITVQGYMTDDEDFSEHYYLFSNATAFKYFDRGQYVTIYITEEEKNKLGFQIAQGELKRVEITGRMYYPRQFEDVKYLTVLD